MADNLVVVLDRWEVWMSDPITCSMECTPLCLHIQSPPQWYGKSNRCSAVQSMEYHWRLKWHVACTTLLFGKTQSKVRNGRKMVTMFYRTVRFHAITNSKCHIWRYPCTSSYPYRYTRRQCLFCVSLQYSLLSPILPILYCAASCSACRPQCQQKSSLALWHKQPTNRTTW
jgi:hypothetical protein